MTQTIKGSRSELTQTAALLIKKAIVSLLRKQPHVVLALAGGRSVAPVFQLLKTLDGISWAKVHIFMVDERAVPLDHPDSNFKLAQDNFIAELVNNGRLPQANVHPFKLGEGVDQYSNELKGLGGRIDLVLLSAGEDGHIASLFPDHPALRDGSEGFIEITDSPKLPLLRVTVSKKLLHSAKVAVLMFLGQAKKRAFKNFSSSSVHYKACPAKLVQSIPGSYLLTDIN